MSTNLIFRSFELWQNSSNRIWKYPIIWDNKTNMMHVTNEVKILWVWYLVNIFTLIVPHIILLSMLLFYQILSPQDNFTLLNIILCLVFIAMFCFSTLISFTFLILGKEVAQMFNHELALEKQLKEGTNNTSIMTKTQ
jgi:hypothetical protein